MFESVEQTSRSDFGKRMVTLAISIVLHVVAIVVVVIVPLVFFQVLPENELLTFLIAPPPPPPPPPPPAANASDALSNAMKKALMSRRAVMA